MPWPAENLYGLIAVALVCSCASEIKSHTRERTPSAEPMGEAAAHAAGEDGDFIVLDLDTGAEVARVPLGAGGFGLAVTPDQSQVWITAPAAGRVLVVGRTSRPIRSTIDLGGIPRRLAFDQSGALVAIADEAGTMRFVR